MEGTGRRKSSTGTSTPKKTTEWLIGRKIKIKTASNEEIQGRIYTYDRMTNSIALDILFIYTYTLFIIIIVPLLLYERVLLNIICIFIGGTKKKQKKYFYP